MNFSLFLLPASLYVALMLVTGRLETKMYIQPTVQQYRHRQAGLHAGETHGDSKERSILRASPMTRQHSATRWMRHDGFRTDGQRRDRQSRLEQIRSLLVQQRRKVDHGMLCRLVNFCEFPPTLTSGSVLVNYLGTLSVPRLVTRHSSFITCHSLPAFPLPWTSVDMLPAMADP